MQIGLFHEADGTCPRRIDEPDQWSRPRQSTRANNPPEDVNCRQRREKREHLLVSRPHKRLRHVVRHENIRERQDDQHVDASRRLRQGTRRTHPQPVQCVMPRSTNSRGSRS